MILRATEGRPASSEPLIAEFGLTEEMLARIADLIQAGNLIAMGAAGAKKLPKFKPQPRPTTGFDRISHKTRLAGHERLVARVKAAQPASPGHETPHSTVSRLDKR